MSFPSIWQPIIAGCILGLFCCEPVVGQSSSVEIVGNAVFIKFHNASCHYMVPSAINVFNVVTGSCSKKAGDPPQGFVRDALGHITIFNVPGATSTQPTSINAQGAIGGHYSVGSSGHAFIRAPDGTFTLFNFIGFDTFVSAINGAGVVTGSYYYSTEGGYMRAADTFTPVGAPHQANGVVPFDINEVGFITGVWFQPISDVPQGFVRAPDGTEQSFGPGGAYAVVPFAINRSGAIAGFWRDPVARFSGFLRAPDGTITSYPYPGSVALVGPRFTSRSSSGVLGGINAAGTVTGTYLDSNKASHGFVRTPDGVITTFDLGGGDTAAVAINDYGIIVGYHRPNSNTSTGYLRVPQGIIAH